MRVKHNSLFTVLVVCSTLFLAGCSVTPVATPTETQSQSETPSQTPTIDPSVIPSASPTAVVTVDAALFLDSNNEYLFRIGEGPVWCTIVPDGGEVVCELNEAAAKYKPVVTPDTCDYSYGYQIALSATKPDGSDTARFLCSGGYYSDPTSAPVLNSGEEIIAAGFTCFVQDVIARCENESANYIVLGPKAWALGN